MNGARTRSLPNLSTTSDLRRAQEGLALLGRVSDRTEQVALARAVGRITAGPYTVSLRPDDHFNGAQQLVVSQGLPAGLVVQVFHLPMLAAAGFASIEVRARLRVGLLSFDDVASRHRRPDSPLRQMHKTITAATLRGLIERLGVHVSEAACRPEATAEFAASLEKLFSSCDLVLISGFLTPVQAALLRSSLIDDGGSAIVEDVVLRPIGALQVGRSHSQLAIAVSADHATAFSAFVLLVSPLVRRLQGRRSILEEPVSAVIAEDCSPTFSAWGVFPAREGAKSDEWSITLSPCTHGDAALCLAQASGLAWVPGAQPSDADRPVAFYPFPQWLS